MIIDKRKGSALYPVVSGERTDVWARATRLVLAGMSFAYSRGHRARMRKLAARPVDRLDAPVLSVGNVTLGGTGKTPICRFLTSELEARGRKVGIATRGYGREGEGIEIIRNGQAPPDWHQCGDEPLLFLRGAKDVVVAVNRDRHRAALALTERHGRDVILLDDGFQFVTLHRDVNIVVLDALCPLGYEKLVPAGLLREPVSSLKRADLFWIAKSDVMPPGTRESLMRRLSGDFPGVPVVESIYKPVGFSTISDNNAVFPPESLMGRKTLCTCGIGSPEPFEALVEELSGQATECFRFTDHHPFGENDLNNVEDAAIRAKADVIVTTEKDAIRIPGFFKPRCKWWILEVGVEITAGREHLEKQLDALRGK